LRKFPVSGSIFDEVGEIWEGIAALVTLPDEAVDAFLDQEPLYKNGLYEDFLIQRFKFGGRPGQVTPRVRDTGRRAAKIGSCLVRDMRGIWRE
jgi:hypothetical protein